MHGQAIPQKKNKLNAIIKLWKNNPQSNEKSNKFKST